MAIRSVKIFVEKFSTTITQLSNTIYREKLNHTYMIYCWRGIDLNRLPPLNPYHQQAVQLRPWRHQLQYAKHFEHLSQQVGMPNFETEIEISQQRLAPINFSTNKKSD